MFYVGRSEISKGKDAKSQQSRCESSLFRFVDTEIESIRKDRSHAIVSSQERLWLFPCAYMPFIITDVFNEYVKKIISVGFLLDNLEEKYHFKEFLCMHSFINVQFPPWSVLTEKYSKEIFK